MARQIRKGKKPSMRACCGASAPKGQVTVAIIVGIIMLAIIGGLLYQSGLLAKTKSTKQIETQTMLQTKLIPVRDFVQACLDLSTKDALITLGRQGGYLFRGAIPGAPNEGQGGPSPDFLPSETGGAAGRYVIDPDDPTRTIPYTIFKRENTNIAGWLFSDTPQYPFQTFPMYRLEEDLAVPCKTKEQAKASGSLFDSCYHYDGIYGANLLPPLLKPGTQPLPDFLNPDKSKPAIDSMQSQLETYIINHTLSCVDFSKLAATNIEFQPGEASANVTFTESSTIVNLHYPLNMTDRQTSTKMALADWASVIPVRLEYLHLILDFATSREGGTILFFMSNLTNPDHSVTPAIRKGIIPGSNDYIVTYTDRASLIDGKPFEFKFAVHNRPPALYYVNRTVKADTKIFGPEGAPVNGPGPNIGLELSKLIHYTVCATRLPSGSPVPAEIKLLKRAEEQWVVEIHNPGGLSSSECPSEKLIIPLYAIDPDEDLITYSIKTTFADGPDHIEVGPDIAAYLESSGRPIELTVEASDGKLKDWQTVNLKVHYEPPPAP